jgi:hypothetical protein
MQKDNELLPKDSLDIKVYDGATLNMYFDGQDEMTVEIVYRTDDCAAYMSLDKAKQIRDWLNKMLP